MQDNDAEGEASEGHLKDLKRSDHFVSIFRAVMIAVLLLAMFMGIYLMATGATCPAMGCGAGGQ